MVRGFANETCGLLHLPQSEGAHLAWGVLLALRLDPGIAARTGHNFVWHVLRDVLRLVVLEFATDEALRRVQCVRRIRHSDTLRGESDLRRAETELRARPRSRITRPADDDVDDRRVNRLSRRTYQALAVIGEGSHGRGGTHALDVLDDAGGGTVHDSDARVCGSQVNTNDASGNVAAGGEMRS